MVNIKTVWTLFLISLFTIVPIKMYSSLMQNDWQTQPVFMVVVMTFFVLLILSVVFCKNLSDVIDSRGNISIAVISLILFVSFILCGIYYFKDDSYYEFELHPLLMSMISFFTSITFLFIFLTCIRKENMFKKASIFVFGPVVWFCTSMIMFLSITNNNPNFYEILLKSLLLLFFVYQTQIFIFSTDKNIPKRLFIFGIPAMLGSLIHNLPEIISGLYFRNITNINLIVNITEMLCAVYVLIVLMETQKNYLKNQNV